MSEMPQIVDCWNKIGVSGDGSCPELDVHVHCRNCPVYSDAARSLLDREISAEYLEGYAHHIAADIVETSVATISSLIFRLGTEWLALPTKVFQEIAQPSPFHSLPRRSDTTAEGLVNIRGELIVFAVLETLLGLAEPPPEKRFVRPIIVLLRDGEHLAFPVDEVGGVHRYRAEDVLESPATVAKSPVRFTTGLIPWNERLAGRLDAELLFYAVTRNLA